MSGKAKLKAILRKIDKDLVRLEKVLEGINAKSVMARMAAGKIRHRVKPVRLKPEKPKEAAPA